MAKTKNLNLVIDKDFEKVVIKHSDSESKLIMTFKKEKPKKFLENWYKKLNEFLEENNKNN